MGPPQEVVAEQSSETTVVAAIEQPTPAVVVGAEAVPVTAFPSPEVKREEGPRPAGDLDGASNAGEFPEQKVACYGRMEASLVGCRAGYRIKPAIDVPVQIGLLGKMKLRKCAPIAGKPATGVSGLRRLPCLR